MNIDHKKRRTMADITKRNGNDCTIKETCYRFTAKAHPYRQSYAAFKQDENGKCDDYWRKSSQ